MRKAWVFYDPLDDTEYRWEVNPSQDSGSLGIVKDIGFSAMAGMHQTASGYDDISAIVSSNGPSLRTLSFSGATLTKGQLDSMNFWSSKPYPIELTDDLGRTFEILVKTFTTARVRSRMYPWKHSYNFEAIVLREL